MRWLTASVTALVMLAGTADARDLPAGLVARIEEGVKACMAFYERGESISSLAAIGYVSKPLWMEIKVDLSAETGIKRPFWVRVLIERTFECEIHSNYTRFNIEPDAFDLARKIMAAHGFVITKGQFHAPAVKSIVEKGPVSMWFKVRNTDNTLMVKFLARSR